MMDEINNLDNENQTAIRNCWDCNYQKIGGDSFLGICTWFSKHRNMRDKEILPSKVDIGCKYFEQR